MQKYIHEYRINKKGAECYRSDSFERTKEKLEALRAKKPNVKYEMQTRWARVNRYGITERNWKGETAWSIWMND